MPKDFLYETAITIDHEDGLMRVDTTVTSMATALQRAGFTETTKPSSQPYRRFIGQADQIRFRKAKGFRHVGGAAAQKMAARTTAAVENPTQISPISNKPISR